MDRQRPGAMFGPETLVERVDDDALGPLSATGDFAYVDPDEPAAHDRMWLCGRKVPAAQRGCG